MSIRINGKKYINGTVVRANPVEEATGTLEKIGIGSNVYEIQGSGGGGGSSSGVYIERELWADANGLEFYPSLSPQITLSDGLSNYDFVYLDTTLADGTNYHNTNLIAVSAIYKQSGKYNGVVNIGGHIYNCPSFEYVDDTHIKLVGYASANHLKAWRFVGIKVSGDYYSPVIYSTEEREIGVWTDNKPLYQKTFLFNQQVIRDNAWTSNILGTVGSGIEIVDYEGMFGLENMNPHFADFDYYRGSNEYFTAYIVNNNGSNDDIGVRPSMNAGANVTLDKCTIWYTKDSDVAGSGSYNTLGVPTVHYTTDEQVIGTWIDGKPLYRKVIEFASTQTFTRNTDKDITSLADFSSVKQPISCGGFYDSTSEEQTTPMTIYKYNNKVYAQTYIDIALNKLILEYTKTTD